MLIKKRRYWKGYLACFSGSKAIFHHKSEEFSWKPIKCVLIWSRGRNFTWLTKLTYNCPTFSIVTVVQIPSFNKETWIDKSNNNNNMSLLRIPIEFNNNNKRQLNSKLVIPLLGHSIVLFAVLITKIIDLKPTKSIPNTINC